MTSGGTTQLLPRESFWVCSRSEPPTWTNRTEQGMGVGWAHRSSVMFKATPAYKGQLSSFLGKLCMAKEGKEKTRNIRNQTEQKDIWLVHVSVSSVLSKPRLRVLKRCGVSCAGCWHLHLDELERVDVLPYLVTLEDTFPSLSSLVSRSPSHAAAPTLGASLSQSLHCGIPRPTQCSGCASICGPPLGSSCDDKQIA